MNQPACSTRPLHPFALRLACVLALTGGQAKLAGQQSVPHLEVGDPMPPITAQQSPGDTFSLANEAGKIVVINIWATWCGPCKAEMPRLETAIWQKYRSNPDFVMVAIAREQSKKTVLKFQRKHPTLDFPMGWDPDRTAYKQIVDKGIPRTYVVDRQGKIAYQSFGYSPNAITTLDRAIEKALADK